MRITTLLARNLTWHWRTNAAVVCGVAVAVAVLAGALLVGHSVRASLRDLVLERLGKVEHVVSADHFFRDALAGELGTPCPVIALTGALTHEASGRRALDAQVYGVDDRFWKFQGYGGEPPRNREVYLSGALAREFGAAAGDAILLRVEKPSAIPLESLHGRKEDSGRTIRLTLAAPTPGRDRAESVEFSLRQQQGAVRAVFVPLSRLQRDLGLGERMNTILTAGGDPAKALKERFRLDDLGIRVRLLAEQKAVSLESESSLVGDALAETATEVGRRMGLTASPVLAYLANRIRAGDRQVPYSLVAAVEMPDAAPDSITLNDWTARDLGVRAGDKVSLDYFVWKGDGRLATESAEFRLGRVVPIEGFAADRGLAPDYPGITESESLRGWDPPFPLDLKQIRPRDEDYWKRYRTTAKAFLPIARGQQLWQTRFGKLTSLRFAPASAETARVFSDSLREALDPARMGLTVFAARAEGLRAAEGSTDFGEYFVYFSFFLMVSALLLTGLFFRLGVEQRMREIGVLRALGYARSQVRSILLLEGLALASLGAAAGTAGALAYAALLVYGLRTWWVGAVGTTLLSLHVSPWALAAGAAAGLATGLGSIAWSLRSLAPATPRGLMMEAPAAGGGRRRPLVAAVLAGAAGLGLTGAGLAGRVEASAAFFGAGALLLAASLCAEWLWLSGRGTARVSGVARLGFRFASVRPGRSVLCVATIASAAFLIVSLDAFRRTGGGAGTGGFPLVAEAALPLVHNPNTAAGREALSLPPLEGVRLVPFRLKPGDDASCLNLYRPRNPRVLAPPPDFLTSAKFEFQDSTGKAANPWLLLEAPEADGAIPAIADANSMAYSLHVKLGEEFTVEGKRFRMVAALRDSIFQGELLISEANFVKAFPEYEGFRFFLAEAPAGKAAETAAALERALADYGFDATGTEERLASFHRVENTYLSTFQALGALGLALGTVGLAAIILRNVLERRRQLAMLRAVGYRAGHLRWMTLAENALLLGLGLGTGAACALVAIAPAVAERGGRLPSAMLVALLASVLLSGAAAALAGTAAALRSPLLETLKSE